MLVTDSKSGSMKEKTMLLYVNRHLDIVNTSQVSRVRFSLHIYRSKFQLQFIENNPIFTNTKNTIKRIVFVHYPSQNIHRGNSHQGPDGSRNDYGYSKFLEHGNLWGALGIQPKYPLACKYPTIEV